ncbi:MAG: carbohydrate ABC transporter substrate-binding protein [Micromonosporaceae bacterium]|nr:carbohydrate ABC transporter substrate-binding protein [Micromonosporaceae bacterium]
MRRNSGTASLAVMLAGVLIAGAACSSAGSGGGDSGDDRVEVFSWWTGEGEEEGLNALIDDFKVTNPGIEFINATVSGGAGVNAKTVLATRLEGEDPPDSYQAHAGLELTSDIKAGRLQALDELYDSQGWRSVFPQGLLDAMTYEGKIYSVPVNIHRANLIWYNPKTLASVGIAEPPKTWSELLAQATILRSGGITPIAVGPLWTQKQLLETVLIGELGAGQYTGLWNGTTDWASPQVIYALTTAARVFAVSDITNASGDWQNAMDKTLAGTAAYNVMGDWAYTYNLGKNLKYPTDFAVTASPGSSGVYDFLSDAFTLPKGAPHPGAAQQWLIECGSTRGQDIFNPLKGSIPARTDADRSKYTDYLAEALEEWGRDTTIIVGSLAHGAAASTEFNEKIDTALTAFVADADAQAFAKAVAKAYQETR